MVEDLETQLRKKSSHGELYNTIEDREKWVKCYACAHYCKIKDGNSGICKVRYNEDGKLYVPFGYFGAYQCDPIEKKPFYHAFPKSLALSFGMLGCDYKCDFCQNWQISQTLRDEHAGRPPRPISIDEILSTGKSLNARAIVSTYNEPLITSEWSKAIFQEAKKQGFATAFVSNGNATEEVLDYLTPYLDLYKVDLKAFTQKAYRSMGGNLEKVLKAIKMIYKRGLWLEIVTLLIPGFNDSPDEIKELTEFIVDISPDIPWHVTAFHKDYRMNEPDNTKPGDLITAATIGQKSGLNFVYPGNVHGRVGNWENTNCPNCDQKLVERRGFEVLDYHLTDEGRCPKCDLQIPGRWEVPTAREQMFHLL